MFVSPPPPLPAAAATNCSNDFDLIYHFTVKDLEGGKEKKKEEPHPPLEETMRTRAMIPLLILLVFLCALTLYWELGSLLSIVLTIDGRARSHRQSEPEGLEADLSLRSFTSVKVPVNPRRIRCLPGDANERYSVTPYWEKFARWNLLANDQVGGGRFERPQLTSVDQSRANSNDRASMSDSLRGVANHNNSAFEYVQVLGMFNSGTNAMKETLMGCAGDALHVYGGKQTKYHWKFWKHLHPSQPDFKLYNETVYIIMVREPFAWVEATKRKPYDLRCSRLDSTCRMKHDGVDSTFPSLMQVWLSYMNAYITLKQEYPTQVIIVHYEDFLTRWKEVREALARSGVPLEANCSVFGGEARSFIRRRSSRKTTRSTSLLHPRLSGKASSFALPGLTLEKGTTSTTGKDATGEGGGGDGEGEGTDVETTIQSLRGTTLAQKEEVTESNTKNDDAVRKWETRSYLKTLSLWEREFIRGMLSRESASEDEMHRNSIKVEDEGHADEDNDNQDLGKGRTSLLDELPDIVLQEYCRCTEKCDPTPFSHNWGAISDTRGWVRRPLLR